MEPRRQHLWPSLMMAASLVLLAGFEFLWLKSEYRAEEDHLREEQSIRLHNAIRELEDSLIQVALWSPVVLNADSFECALPRIRIAHHALNDTTRSVTIMRSKEFAMHDTLKFERRRHKKGSMFLGALSQHLTEAIDTAGKDSLQVTVALMDVITDKIEETPVDAPLTFNIVSWDQTPPDSIGLLSRSYFDVSTGKHYALQYPGYRSYLLKQILPQIGFALLLFACIAVAFSLVMRNLRKQQRLAEMRSNLISNITHELKTPIATVNIALEALQNFHAGSDPVKRTEYLNIAQSEVNRLGLLVDNVLKTSSGIGNGKLHVERFDFRELVQHVLDTLRMHLGLKEARVDLTTTGDDFHIEADKLHLTGLVHNLVDNAVKYGGTQPQVNVHLEQQNGQMIFSVRDHGIGIPKEYTQKIFDKFFRVPNGDIHNIKGHGLGLSYVAEVVRAHEGTIDVSTEPGKGSTFTVTLPRTHAN